MSNSTRTGVRKFVPLMVTWVPPLGGPLFGTMLVIVGVVDGGCGVTGCVENVTVVDLDTLPTVAETVAVPAAAEVSVAVATPLVVVRIVVFAPVSVNVPRVVVNCTAVPLGTFALFSCTVAVMMTLEFTSGFALETVSVMVALVGGVTPPPGVVPPGVNGGAVGDSALQPARISSNANTGKISFRCLMSIISTPVNSSIHHSSGYAHPPHEKQKSKLIRVLPETRSPASVVPKTSRITSMVTNGLCVSGSIPPF